MKQIKSYEPWIFIFFGLFHLHRIWGLVDRKSYANFWIGVLENKGAFYFILMGAITMLCLLGLITFFKNRHCNYWWRWIYLVGGSYLLFDLFAIAIGLDFWQQVLLNLYDTTSIYWNFIWSIFILLGAMVFTLGISLIIKKRM